MGWKKFWSKGSYISKGFGLGLVIGIIIFFLSGILMFFYTATHIGRYSCPAFADSTTCEWKNVGGFIFQALIFVGIPGLILSTIFGLFVGWSLSNKRVLTWEGIVAGVYILIAALLIIISLFSQEARSFLFGGRIEFASLGVYLLIAIAVGAIIGWIIGRIKLR